MGKRNYTHVQVLIPEIEGRQFQEFFANCFCLLTISS